MQNFSRSQSPLLTLEIKQSVQNRNRFRTILTPVGLILFNVERIH